MEKPAAMSKEGEVTRWELVRAKARIAGPVGLIRIGWAKLIGPMAVQWRRFHGRRRRDVFGTRALAHALQADERELADRLAAIRCGLADRLPTGPQDAPAVRVLYQQQAPEELQSCVQAADRLCEHVFDLLGSGPTCLGKAIDWHADFKSGYRWDPARHYLFVPHGHVPGTDIKVPWELSRGQHLPVLAQAYLLTGEQRYASEIVEQIADWIAKNPPGYGVNWACPMEAAVRAVNWLWAIALIAESPAVTSDWLADALLSLVAHGRHIMENLERRSDGVTTNHYLADIVGLLHLGLCLPECCDGRRWRDFALQELVREMDCQVLDDGVHF